MIGTTPMMTTVTVMKKDIDDYNDSNMMITILIHMMMAQQNYCIYLTINNLLFYSLKSF